MADDTAGALDGAVDGRTKTFGDTLYFVPFAGAC